MYWKILKFVLYVFISCWLIFTNLFNAYWINNPYSGELNQVTKLQIDNLVTSISNKKIQLSTAQFNIFSDDIIRNLANLKNKYSTNNDIINIVNYLSYEINDLKKDPTISEKDLEKIICSTWKCENISAIVKDNWTVATTNEQNNTTSSGSSQNLGNDFWNCDRSWPLYYKSWNICTWANFECKNWKYYWWAQFSPEPTRPELSVKLYNTYNSCNIEISANNTWVLVNNTVKSCSFNLTPYYNLWLKTTFYYSDKSYIPDSNGNMTLPWNMVSNFYAYKWDAINPQIYFKCSDWVLSIYNSEYKTLKPLNWVIDENYSSQNGTPVRNTPNIKNINITCAWNWWPASVDISWSWDFNVFWAKNWTTNKYINLSKNYTTNNFLAQLSSDIEKIIITPYNSSEIISSIDVNQCNPNNYAKKPEIISANYNTETNTIIIKTKNALDNDQIDIFNGQSNWGLFWEKDSYWTYSVKLTDNSYKSLISFIKTWKSYVWIYWSFEPNYWRNSIRNITVPVNVISEPNFSFTRSYDSKWQWLEWKTNSNVANLARKSIWPNWVKSNDHSSLSLQKNFLSFEELKINWWINWKYNMTRTITLKDWTSKSYKENFYIPQ